MGIDRRSFLRLSALATGTLAAPNLRGLSFAPPLLHENQLVILHTNDVHSRVEAFPASDARYGGQGGAAGRMQLIEKIRTQYSHVLLLDSGDIFQGTPYFNFFGGELEMKLMQMMGYDAATMGNHDFDAGIDGFVKQLPHVQFPFLTANYDFSQTALAGRTQEHLIVQKGPFKVGLFGLGIELHGLVPKKLYGDTLWLDPIEKAREQVQWLQKKNCNWIVCLSHLGYAYDSDKVSDQILAKEVPGIDLILGGHTHTFLEKAVEVPHSDGRSTFIAQTGWAGLRLGMQVVRLDKDSAVSSLTQSGSWPVYG